MIWLWWSTIYFAKSTGIHVWNKQWLIKWVTRDPMFFMLLTLSISLLCVSQQDCSFTWLCIVQCVLLCVVHCHAKPDDCCNVFDKLAHRENNEEKIVPNLRLFLEKSSQRKITQILVLCPLIFFFSPCWEKSDALCFRPH